MWIIGDLFVDAIGYRKAADFWALSWIQVCNLLSFGTLSLHSDHSTALFGSTINPEIPTAQQRNVSPVSSSVYTGRR